MLGTPEWGGVIYGGKNLAESLKGLLNNEGTSTTDTESIPTMAGCRNTSGLGKVVPLILGKTKYTPSFIGNPFHTISGADGETETFHALYNLGYKDVQVKNVSLDIYDVANNDELVESGNLSINPDSIYNENDYKTKIVLDNTGGYYDFNGQLQWNGGYQQRVVEEERNVELICEETDLDGNTKSLAVPFFSEKYPHRMEVEIQLNGLLQYNDEGEEEETEVELEIKMSKDGGSTYQSIRNGGFFVNTNTDGNVKFEPSTTSTSNITKIKGKKNKVLRYVCPISFTWEDVKDVKNNRLEFIIQRKNYTPKEKNARNQVYLTRVRTWCYNRKESLAQDKMIVQFPITEKLKKKIKTLSFSISTGKQEAYNVLDKLNVELTSKARIWNSTTKKWSTDYHPTNNIASIVLMLLQHDCRGKKIVSDERIDLKSFGRFYEFCEKKKLYCNGAVSKESKTIDILNELLVIGRGIFVLNGNKYAIAIDDVQENPVMVLNSQNILSISHSKAFEEKIDGYQATFVNALNDYQEDEIIVADADLSDENTTLERVTVNYVTDPAQVQKYLYYKLANRRLRNEKSQIRLSVDGYLIEVGNLVLVQEESLSVGIGQGAEIKRVVTDGEYITGVLVDANFNTTDTSKEYGIEVNITLLDNYNGDRVVTYKLKNLNVVSSYLEFDTPIHLDSAVYPQVGDIISFGIYGNITTKRLCVSKKENGDGTFDLDFIPYQEGVYTADEGEIPEFISNVSSVKETSSASLSSVVPTVTLEELNKRLETANVLTVNSIKEQYYSSTSRTEVIGGEWVETPPQSEDGKYIWTKSIFIYSDGTSTETEPISVSGESGYGIESIDMEYARNQDSTTPPIDGWSTNAPLYNPNYFIWTRTKTKIQNSDEYKYTDPVCINGIKGDKGDTGEKGDTGAKGDKGADGKNAITMTSATTPNGEYNGQIGIWQGQVYQWNGTSWVLTSGILPTAPVLHYSFDELPDIPDGTNNFTGVIAGDYYTKEDIKGGYRFTVNGIGPYIIFKTDIGAVEYLALCYRQKAISKTGGRYLNEAYMFYAEGSYVNISKFIPVPTESENIVRTIIPCDKTKTVLYIRLDMFSGEGHSAVIDVTDMYIGDASYTTPIIDNSGNNNNTTLTNGIVTYGINNKGLFLNKQISGGNFKMPSDFTVSLWCKAENDTKGLFQNIIQTDNYVFVIRNGATWGDYLMYYVYTQKEDGSYDSAGRSFFSGYSLLPANVWVNLAITKKDNIIKCYYNGELKQIDTRETGVLASHSILYIGDRSNTRGQTIDDFQIFDRALSDQEVLGLYLARGNTSKQYTKADYQLDNSSGKYYGYAKPAVPFKNDTYLNTTTGYLYEYDGVKWVAIIDVSDSRYNQAINDMIAFAENNPDLPFITARNAWIKRLTVGGLLANEIATKMLIVRDKGVIKSENYNGTIDENGNITAYGSAGWAIDHAGKSDFVNINATGGNFNNVSVSGFIGAKGLDFILEPGDIEQFFLFHSVVGGVVAESGQYIVIPFKGKLKYKMEMKDDSAGGIGDTVYNFYLNGNIYKSFASPKSTKLHIFEGEINLNFGDELKCIMENAGGRVSSASFYIRFYANSENYFLNMINKSQIKEIGE